MPDEPPEREQPSPDRAAWQDALRGVTPLRREHALATVQAPERWVKGPPEANTTSAQRRPLASDRLPGIDRTTAERLKRGRHEIEARLDLHGMTQREAHRALGEFVHAAAVAGRRCLLVVTGRGLGVDGPGILKRAVPRWLDEGELRRHILAVAPAQPRHGGAGALYVLLRRRR